MPIHSHLGKRVLVLLVAIPLLTISVNAVSAQEDASSEHSVEVIATGLDNPRGIAIGPNGSIYVAESGSGGPELILGEDGSAVCAGMTGYLTKIRGDKVTELASFPSLAEAVDPDGPGPVAPACTGEGAGFATTGPAGVDVEADGDVIVSVGLGGDPAFRDMLPEAMRASLGTLQKVKADGSAKMIADLVAFEAERNPDKGEVDSNPFGVASLDYGRRLVADSGGNDIVVVNAWGGVERYASSFPPLAPQPFTPPSCFADLPEEVQQAFPPPGAPIPPQAVPTAVTVGPDGAYYVALLTGFPFITGAAAVYRVDPVTGAFSTYASGLSSVMGLDFGPDGKLYVVELISTSLLEAEICDEGIGTLIQIDHGVKTVIADDLLFPGGVVVDYYGAIYVTTGSLFPGGGEVIKITLAD